MNEWLALALVVVCFGAAALGSWAITRGLREWYPALRKPSWNPPNAVFGPVWTILYLAMAVAVWLVWRSGGEVMVAVGLFALQLALNVEWSVVFFGQRKPRGGLVVIVGLWLAFASVLNGTIARLNPST